MSPCATKRPALEFETHFGEVLGYHHWLPFVYHLCSLVTCTAGGMTWTSSKDLEFAAAIAAWHSKAEGNRTTHPTLCLSGWILPDLAGSCGILPDTF